MTGGRASPPGRLLTAPDVSRLQRWRLDSLSTQFGLMVLRIQAELDEFAS